jgi:hypothetical protein
MVYNELEQGNILSEVRVGLASIAYMDISLRSIWAIYKIRQTPIIRQHALVLSTPCAPLRFSPSNRYLFRLEQSALRADSSTFTP